MAAYFVDKYGAEERRRYPRLDHPAFYRVDDEMRVWLVSDDGQEDETFVLTLAYLRKSEYFEEVSREAALARLNNPPPPSPGADRPRSTPDDAW